MKNDGDKFVELEFRDIYKYNQGATKCFIVMTMSVYRHKLDIPENWNKI